MSSAGARVIVRGVQPADRAAWDKLFQAYREFYKLPHDAAVRAAAQHCLLLRACSLSCGD